MVFTIHSTPFLPPCWILIEFKWIRLYDIISNYLCSLRFLIRNWYKITATRFMFFSYNCIIFAYTRIDSSMRFCLIYRLIRTRIRTVKLTAIFYLTYNLYNFFFSFFSLYCIIYRWTRLIINIAQTFRYLLLTSSDLRYTDILLTSYMKIFFFPFCFMETWWLKKKKKRRNSFFSVFMKRSISRVENFCTYPFLIFSHFTYMFFLLLYKNLISILFYFFF